MSTTLDSAVSHNQSPRMLDDPTYEIFGQKSYWKRIKSLVREVENAEGCMLLDDFIEEKPHSKENSLISYPYSHLQGRSVKGIQIIHLHYNVEHLEKEVNLPVGYALVVQDQVLLQSLKLDTIGTT